jgi:hypothetical protein
MTRYTPLWLQAGSYAASVDRRLMGALWPNAASTGCLVTLASGMTVNIAPGTVAVPTQNATGSTLCVSDAIEQVTLAGAPASGSNRYDLIICQPRGNDLDAGANNDFIFTTVTGVAAATPTPPAVPAGAAALAQIYVPGGSASITAGNIVDRRPGGLPIPPVAGTGSYPRGFVATATGPASAVVVGATVVLVFSMNFQTVVGRKYKLSWFASWFGSGSATGVNNQSRSRLDGADTQIQGSFTNTGNVWTACSAFQILDGDGAQHNMGISAVSGNPAGASVTYNPNTVRLLVEDIGST